MGFVILYWLCAACVFYAYAGYPLILATIVKIFGRPTRLGGDAVKSVSVIVAAYNEEASIGRRIQELKDLIDAAGVVGEIIIVSDGSTDGTVAKAQASLQESGRVIELSANRGKAAALTEACAAARHDIIVFADARQTWSPDALKLLLENFADPTVGAATGDLMIQSAPGVMAGVGLYWRYEKWLRKQESRLHSTVGATGAISAVRRELFRPIPPGTILDDVYWPLRVVMQRLRVVHDGRAHAHDRLPERTRDEFRRKVRTLSGNFQLLARLPAALLPWRNPIWFQFISHKLFRLLAPWALLILLGLSAILTGPIYRIALAAQLIFYLIGLIGMSKKLGARSRLVSAAASFIVLNSAAWLGFWVWIFGRSSRSWKKVSYQPAAQPVG